MVRDSCIAFSFTLWQHLAREVRDITSTLVRPVLQQLLNSNIISAVVYVFDVRKRLSAERVAHICVLALLCRWRSLFIGQGIELHGGVGVGGPALPVGIVACEQHPSLNTFEWLWNRGS